MRTICRDMAELQGSGMPIGGEAGVGYVLPGGFHLPPPVFTPDEIAAVMAGARPVLAFGGASMASAAEKALVRTRAILPREVAERACRLEIHAVGWDITPALRERLDALERTVEGRLTLGLASRNAEDRETDRIAAMKEGPRFRPDQVRMRADFHRRMEAEGGGRTSRS